MALRARIPALLLCVICCVSLPSTFATAEQGAPAAKRYVLIGVINPPKGLTARIGVREGESASMSGPDVGSFKFVPTLREGDNKNVVLKVLDANSGQQIDLLRLTVGGKAAQPKGLPFQLEILAVTTPK